MEKHRMKDWQKVVIMFIEIIASLIVIALGIVGWILGEKLYAIEFVMKGLVIILVLIVIGISAYKRLFQHYNQYEVNQYLFNNELYNYAGANRSFDDVVALWEEVASYNYDNYPYSEIKITGITSEYELKEDKKYKVEMKTHKNGDVEEVNITEMDSNLPNI